MLYETAIIQSLQALGLPSNLTFVLADRNGVEAPAPYCLITLLPVVNVGQPFRTSTRKDGQEVETVLQTKELTCSLTFHMSATDPTQDVVEKFHMGLGSSLYQSAFVNNGLGIFDYTDIVYQSLPVDGNNYKRAIIDISFRFERIEDFYAPFITRIETTGNLGTSDTDFTSDIDFTTP